MLRPLPKLLIVFNLEGTLCKIQNKQGSTIFSESSSVDLSLRPHLDSLLRFLFIRNKLYFKVGVWTSLSAEATEILSKKVFLGHNSNLLFKYASPEQKEPRDLKRIWYNYNDFNSFNTVYADFDENSVLPSENLLLMPTFNNDECLNILQDYIKFFSYQYQQNRANDFLGFMRKVPFREYFLEHSKVDIVVPTGEASRFW